MHCGNTNYRIKYWNNQTRSFAVGQDMTITKARLKDCKGNDIDLEKYFLGKRIALLGSAGAFTDMYSSRQLPYLITNAEQIKSKGIDKIACVSINDHFTMNAWGNKIGAEDKIDMLADWNGEFTKQLGMEEDLSKLGLGTRTKGFLMLVDDGRVVEETIETKPDEFEARIQSLHVLG